MQATIQTTVIVIDENPESSEVIARILRDAGQSLTIDWVNSALRLQRFLDAENVGHHIVLANANLAWLPMAKVCHICSERHVLAMAIGDIPNTTLELRTLQEGAFALVSPNHPGLLVHRLNQAIAHSLSAQSLRQQASKLEDLNLRCEALFDTAAEAIAYTHEGVITSANSLFAHTVGAESTTQLVGRLISDFIGPESLYKFSRHLRCLMRGEHNQAHLEDTTIKCLNGDTENVMLFMNNITVDNEHGTQILVRQSHAQTAALAANVIPADAASHAHAMHSANVTTNEPFQKQTPQTVPSLKLVESQNEKNAVYNVALKNPLEASMLNSTMARLNSLNDKSQTPHSANDNCVMASLPELLANGGASLHSQALLSMHSHEPLSLARIKANDTLMSVTQVFEDTHDHNSTAWLLEQLNLASEHMPLVLGPVTKEIIHAKSVEQLRARAPSNRLILGLSELALSDDYHGSCQFLLQLQKLGMQAALWMNSPPSVFFGLLADLPHSVRSGIHTVVLCPQDAPTIVGNSIQPETWAPLIGLCQNNNIQFIAPQPCNESQLQAWWQLGASWCLTDTNTTKANTLKHTGTNGHS